MTMYTQMLQVHASVWPTESDITAHDQYQSEPHNVNYPLPEGKIKFKKKYPSPEYLNNK